MERSAWFASLGTLDASVDGIQGLRCDTSEPKCAGIDPHAVMIPVHEGDRPVRDDSVKHISGRRPACKELHRPACAHDPLCVWMRTGVFSDQPEAIFCVFRAGEIALQQFDSPGDGMDVSILKSWQQ